MSTANKIAQAAARVAIALIFLNSGLGKLANPKMTEGFMAAHGMPLVPLFFAAAVVIEIGGSLWLISGWKLRWSTFILAFFLVPTTLIFHNFWAAAPKEHMMQQMNFMKNLTIIGGLLLISLRASEPVRVELQPAAKEPEKAAAGS